MRHWIRGAAFLFAAWAAVSAGPANEARAETGGPPTTSSRGHAYAVIAGLRLDTSMTPGEGPGWSKRMRSGRGYTVRHPVGL